MTLAPYIVLVTVTCVLSVIASAVAGAHAVHPIGTNQISVVIGFLFFFVVALTFAMLGDAVRLARRFNRENGAQIGLRALSLAAGKPGIGSFLLVIIAAYGVGASANLAEVYRVESVVWNDEWLWEIEQDLFHALLALPVNVPKFWDAIYQTLWVVVFLGLAGLACAKKTHAMAAALCGVVIAFHLTRYVAIAIPSAGPVFFQPDLFELSGTGSATLVPLLREYMAGHVAQNGFLPGTQAFPSLHVGLAWCAVVVMAGAWRWTLWFSLPWFVLNWLATLFLGWHYAVDGIGGIAVMSLALVIAHALMRIGSWCSSLTLRMRGEGMRACGGEPVSRAESVE
ncbi:PAP2 superfamily protein [Azoarcus sp. Aa7]|nr:PAP2 superfamily protein [Azoarcus sp. Aa7]